MCEREARKNEGRIVPVGKSLTCRAKGFGLYPVGKVLWVKSVIKRTGNKMDDRV